MANLLPGKSSREDFASLDPEQLDRLESRLRSVADLCASFDGVRRVERRLHAFETTLEELQSDPSLVAALDLLDGIERQRQTTLAESAASGGIPVSVRGTRVRPRGGQLVCYRPGRSLTTGEANLASRGFFDLLDRPPLHLWLEAIARPTGRAAGDFEVVILAWVPQADADAAGEGCRACTSGALALLAEASDALARQLDPILLSSPED